MLNRPGKRRAVNRPKRRTCEALEGRHLFAAHIVGSSTSYATLQAAVNAASAGAIINVDAGTYTETVTVNKSLTIRGAEAGVDARTRFGKSTSESIVTGATGGGGVNEAFYVTANDVTIDGFTVQGTTNESVSTGAGIVIAPSISGTHILNSEIQNNTSGIFLANNSSTDPVVIQHNVFYLNNNPGSDGGRGIYSDGGISGGNLTNVVIDSNAFYNNHGSTGTTNAEAAISFEAAHLGEQSNIRITNNLFQSNGKATLMEDCNNVLIEGNTATGQGDSAGTIRFEGGDTNITIDDNNVYNNLGAGVAIDSKAVGYDNSGFVINGNDFTGNSQDWGDKLSVIVDEDTYDGTLNANDNWWGSASGPGGQGPGTGDKIYGNGYSIGGEQWAESDGSEATFANWATTAFTWSTPAAPASLSGTATVSGSTASVALSWPGVSTAYTYSIERSTDDTNFQTIAVVASTATSYTDSSVATGGTYYYRIAAENLAGASAYATTSGISTGTVTVTPPPPPPPSQTVTYISSLNWVSATVGYATIQKNLSILGNPLTLNGKVYSSGIGTHAVSNIVYNLAGQYTTFESYVGVDDEENGKGVGSVDFQVIGDGKVLFDSGVLHNGGTAVYIDVSVAGVKQLTLSATNGVAGSIDYDHADWAGAELISTSTTAPTAPTNLAAVALSSSSVNLSWTAPSSSNQSGYSVQRSTDGVNFTTIATGLSSSATSFIDTGPLAATTKFYYRIFAVNSIGNSGYSNIASATTLTATTVTYVSNLTPTSATIGYGTIHKNLSVDGNPITLNGTVYTEGIGTHALSDITYNLAGNYTTFISDVGIDQEEDGSGVGDVDFQLIGDGKVLFDSGVLTNDQVAHIDVSVVGVQNLTLVAANGIPNDIDYDHSDWAGAELLS
jgi:nitrous oxidase accessory protein NosD